MALGSWFILRYCAFYFEKREIYWDLFINVCCLCEKKYEDRFFFGSNEIVSNMIILMANFVRRRDTNFGFQCKTYGSIGGRYACTVQVKAAGRQWDVLVRNEINGYVVNLSSFLFSLFFFFAFIKIRIR